MAKLYFRYGAMNSGKSTAVLQVAHNYEERDMEIVLIKPEVDTKGNNQVISRLGASRTVDVLLKPKQDIFQIIAARKEAQPSLSCALIDEAQFLTQAQVSQLFKVAIELNIPVICYGLRADFQTKTFEGSGRLFELAHSIEELKTICRCGKKAILNGRRVNDTFVASGSQVAIDGEQDVTYESLCGNCYLKYVGDIA
ncbi:MAG: thymidine kinase [Candidatus Saccharimonadales bacterium]